MNIPKQIIKCVECGKDHLLTELTTTPFFGDGLSFYCPQTKFEIARFRLGSLVVWTGKQFSAIIEEKKE